MYTLVSLLVDVCLLRKGPQDLPASYVLLKLSAVVYALSGLLVLMAGMSASAFLLALLLVTLDMTLLVALTYSVLNILGRLMRLAQTLTALFGVGALLQLLAWPLALWLQRELALEGDPSLPTLLSLSLLAWSLLIMGHILQHAFSVSKSIGIMYALVYLAVSLALGEWLLPAPVEPL